MKIKLNEIFKTIALSVRYCFDYYSGLHEKNKGPIICQENDISHVEDQKAYVKKKNYYKSSYIDSIEF